MSNNDKVFIRDMVTALSTGDREAANVASAEVFASKTAAATESIGVDEITEESADEDGEGDSSEELTEGSHMLRAARKHNSAGARNMKSKRNMGRHGHARANESGERDTGDMGRRHAFESGKTYAYETMGKKYKMKYMDEMDMDMDIDYEAGECDIEDEQETERFNMYEMGKKKAYAKMGKSYESKVY